MLNRSDHNIPIAFPGKVFFSLLTFLLVSFTLFAQKAVDKKEVINITSSFKPSIVRTGKLEFYAQPVPKDTTAYQFSYPQPSISFSTSLSSFSIRPLAFIPDSSRKDEPFGYVKIGFGNFNTPFASLGLQQTKGTDLVALNLDHLSSRGKLPDQQFSTSSLGLKFKRRFSENQSVSFFGGYSRSDYRKYGFDHSQFSFSKNELQQQFNRYHAGGEYHLLAGQTARTVLTPSFRVDYLSSNSLVREYGLKAGMPVEHFLNEKISLLASPRIDYTNLNTGSAATSTGLFQVPLLGTYVEGGLLVRAGFVPYFAGGNFNVLPDLFAQYRLSNNGIRLKGGIENSLAINAYSLLTTINPFLSAFNSLTTAKTTTYHAGADWLNNKGLQLHFKGGFVQYKNQPLFANLIGTTEKDMGILVESSLQAFTAEAGVDVVLSNTLKFSGAAKFLSFQQQVDYVSPYGLLPFETRLGVEWKPLPAFLVRMNAFAWQGATYRSGTGLEQRLKGAIDASVNLEYRWDKKWAFWMDLNNIANSPYQRWYGYTALGFNAIAGFRYLFNNGDR